MYKINHFFRNIFLIGGQYNSIMNDINSVSSGMSVSDLPPTFYEKEVQLISNILSLLKISISLS